MQYIYNVNMFCIISLHYVVRGELAIRGDSRQRASFLPLFVFALALTWLYERTEGLLAPMLAHGLFNAANLIILLSQTE